MIKNIRESSSYIAIQGTRTELDSKTIDYIDNTFEEIFEGSASKISNVEEEMDCEVIYKISKPVMQDDELLGDYYSSMEILLEVLSEYSPYFTRVKIGDIND